MNKILAVWLFVCCFCFSAISADQVTSYSEVHTGNQPLVEAPWLETKITWQGPTPVLILRVVNLEPGAFVSRWYLKMNKPVVMTVVSGPAWSSSTKITGPFPKDGFDIALLFSTRNNQGGRFESGMEVVIALSVEAKVSAGAAHLQGLGHNNQDSCWVVSGEPETPVDPPKPTVVHLQSISATVSQDGGVDIQWVTSYEFNTLGFHLYRQSGASWIRINPSLIYATGGYVPTTYDFYDPSGVLGAVYRLMEVEMTGSLVWITDCPATAF
jgi:hypothetical protein